MLPFGIHFLPIPEDFWSAYSGEPFCDCIDCGGPLSESPVHIIQKRVVAGETVFEMAMCEPCRQSLTETYSQETRAAISGFMTEQFRKNGEPQLPDSAADSLLKLCMDHCLICGVARELCHRYSLAGLFRGARIVVQRSALGQTPMMVCEKCESGMAGLISKQTRDSWDRFVEEHFDGPPGVDVDAPYDQPIAF